MDRNCLVKNTFIALVRVNIEIFPQKKKIKWLPPNEIIMQTKTKIFLKTIFRSGSCRRKAIT